MLLPDFKFYLPLVIAIDRATLIWLDFDSDQDQCELQEAVAGSRPVQLEQCCLHNSGKNETIGKPVKVKIAMKQLSGE